MLGRKEAVAAISGVLLIGLGVLIALTLPVRAFYLVDQSSAWVFGSRELAHTVGYAGCTLGGWALVRTFGTARGRKTNLTLAVLGLLFYPLSLWGPEWIHQVTSAGLRMLLCKVFIPFYFLGTLMMLQFVKDWPGIVRPVPATLATCFALTMLSIWWEIFDQPLRSVYGGSPRGYIQWAQVACDWVGIWLPAVLLTCRHHRDDSVETIKSAHRNLPSS